MTLLIVTSADHMTVAWAGEGTHARGDGQSVPSDSQAGSDAPSVPLSDTTDESADALGELRLFFAAENRWHSVADRSSSRNPSADRASMDPAFDGGRDVVQAVDRKFEPGTSGQRNSVPVRTAFDFKAILQRGERIQLLIGGQLCRAEVSRSSMQPDSVVRCLRPLPGARSLSFDAHARELLIESTSRRTQRLAVGERWLP